MPFAFNPITPTDTFSGWVNSLLTRLSAYLNSFPGSDIQDSSVSLSKLAKQKARFDCCMRSPLALEGATITTIGSRTMPTSDSAAATYRLVGWSFSVNSGPCLSNVGPALVAGALTKAATAVVRVRVNGVTTLLTIDVSSATALAIGTPLYADVSGSGLTVQSGDVVSWDYVWTAGAGAKYPNPELHLDFTLAHAGL